jgi:hypothetical protein
MKTIAIFLVVAIAVYVFFGCVTYPQWKDYERLVHAGSKTRGRVIAKERENHQNVRYEYSVESKIYSGRSRVGVGGLPPFSQVMIGDEIPITYWPGRPSVSLPGDPAEVFSSWSTVLFGVLPFFSLIAGGSVALQSHRLSSKRTKMNPQENIFSAQWAEYRRLRKTYWKMLLYCFLLILIPIGIGRLGLLKCGLHINLSILICIVVIIGGSLFFYLRAWFRLLRWPCPRCRKPFAFSWFKGGWPTNTCKHCGIDIERPVPGM